MQIRIINLAKLTGDDNPDENVSGSTRIYLLASGYTYFQFLEINSPSNAAFGTSVLQSEVQKVEAQRSVHGHLIVLCWLVLADYIA